MLRTVLGAAALLMSTAPSHALAADDWVAESDETTRKVLQAQGAFFPETAAGLGVDTFDADIIDLRKGVYDRQQAQRRELVGLVDGVRRTTEHPKVLQDLDILTRSLEDQIVSARLNHDLLLPYYNLGQTLFGGFNSLLDVRTDPARYPAALERLRKYTGQDAAAPITELAKARTSERFDETGLTGPYRREVERDLDNLPRFVAGMRQLFERSGLEGWEQDLEQLALQLDDYADWVRSEVLPRAREDHRLPPELYADNLRSVGVREAPEDLIRLAQFSYAEIRAQMKSLARQIAEQRGWENGELMHVIRELKKNQMPQDRLLEIYRERLEVIEDLIVANDIVTLPDRPANIRLATEAESASIPAPFMSPPQLIGNTGQYGEFVLVQKNLALEDEDAQMDDWTHHGMSWPLTVHEARPGHEMQFASLVENGVSLARAIYAFNSANVEGWGLYSEAIMMEHLPLDGQLFTLQARLQRAARMFLDPMVNLGQLTPDEAIDFMTGQVGLSRAMAQSEADRYAFLLPGQATAYFYGYINLQRLRTELELRLGDEFDQRTFHDFLLAQGLLPPDLLREAVLAEFAPAGT
jgi:hypothetical protein